MILDLREIIETPGASVPFSCVLDVERLDFPSVTRYLALPSAEGRVVNTAGVLTLKGELRADMDCLCDRCGKEFHSEKVMELSVPLAASLEDEDNADIFLLDGDCLDLDDVLSTVFILDMETKFLCREDCRGLCPGCGADLNNGPCGCEKPTDPRMAALKQLLEIEDRKQ